MSRSWYIMGFVNIDGSYDVSPLSILVVMNWMFTLWSFVLSDLMFRSENTWHMSCIWKLVVTMGYYFDSLDISYGTELTDSRGDFGVIYAQGLMHVFIIFTPIETLGSPCSSLCGLSIMNMNLLWCYSSTNSRIDRTETIALCYFSMNSWIDLTERIALRLLRTLQTIPIFCSPLIGTREWFFVTLWGIIIWSNYVSTVGRLH